ncbi:phage tail tube protein [Salibacterium aidingense]|uniref:phage tail tube protein n=1 Tax=Salibacterium aidingense TaxID=384933 RepID=UPI003BD5F654
MATPLDPTRVIYGNYGYVYDENGNWLANVMSFEAGFDINKEDIERSGTRKIGKKTTGLDGSGTMGTHKVSSTFISRVMAVLKDSSAPYVTELNVKLEDPDNGGVERWRIKGVQFDNVPIANFEVGSIMEEEFNFTFDDAELVEQIND